MGVAQLSSSLPVCDIVITTPPGEDYLHLCCDGAVVGGMLQEGSGKVGIHFVLHASHDHLAPPTVSLALLKCYGKP